MTLIKPSRSALALGLLTALLPACAETAAEGGAFRVTASGEALALAGYAFPPASGQAIAFADGWEVHFERVLLVIDHVHLATTPDRAPMDPAQMGAEIAELAGPWVVDLAQGGDGTVAGKAAGDRAWVLGTLTEQDNGEPFVASARYALNYALGSASDALTETRGVDRDDPDVAAMIAGGLSHLLVGTATRRAPVDTCTTTGRFDYSELPTRVHFRFGFSLPVTQLNCQNPDLTGVALPGEESQRGVQSRPGEVVDVQLTLHTDHLFWTTTRHGSLPLFNHFAALATPAGDAAALELDGLLGAPLTAPATDARGAPLGWMSCVEPSRYALPTMPEQFTVDAGSLALDDLAEFVSHNAMTMGHLNQDGLCYVAGVEHEH